MRCSRLIFGMTEQKATTLGLCARAPVNCFLLLVYFRLQRKFQTPHNIIAHLRRTDGIWATWIIPNHQARLHKRPINYVNSLATCCGPCA